MERRLCVCSRTKMSLNAHMPRCTCSYRTCVTRKQVLWAARGAFLVPLLHSGTSSRVSGKAGGCSADAVWQHEISFYDLMCQTRCQTSSAVFGSPPSWPVWSRMLSIASVWNNCVWLYSAGCGRTGAICAIDHTWNLLKAGVREDTKEI